MNNIRRSLTLTSTIFFSACVGRDDDTHENEEIGMCDNLDYEVLGPNDIREGVSGAEIVSEFAGRHDASLEWVGFVEGGDIEFDEKGTTTTVTIDLLFEDGETRFYEADLSETGVGCPARFVVTFAADISTLDGVVSLSTPAALEVNTLSAEEREEEGVYKARFNAQAALDELGNMQITAIDPEPAEDLKPIITAGFWQDGTWEGNIGATLQEAVGAQLATGHNVVFGQW